jgi:replicative DNA helicase
VLVRHVDAAARLGHYFLGHALAVFDQMSADPIIDDAAQSLSGSAEPSR